MVGPEQRTYAAARKLFEFTGDLPRPGGGGLGGGIGQSALFTGSFIDPATKITGLDSMGGWAQLKFKPGQTLKSMRDRIG